MLTSEHWKQLAAAHLSSRRLRRALAVATMDGWGIGVFAALTLVTGLSSVGGVLLGLGMGVVAYVEFQTRNRLVHLDGTAPRRLALNQVALGLMLIIYALYGLYSTAHGPSSLADTLRDNPELTSMLSGYDQLARRLTSALYALLIVVAVCVQGGTAWFYLRREKHLADYLRQTPAWIVDLQRRGGLRL